MKVLILTQAMDRDDPVLGFFHGWVEKFALRMERVHVVCLREGAHALSPNVTVHPLSGAAATGRTDLEGTERTSMRLRTVILRRMRVVGNFYRYVWRYRREYDTVFVHMNEEYVLLGGVLWRLMGKRVYMWRNHYAGTVFTGVAVALSTRVFYTSTHSYTARFARAVMMPVGIDTHEFKPLAKVARNPRSILSLGRIAPSKNVHVLIDALGMLKKNGVEFSCDIYGGALPKDESYLGGLERKVAQWGLREHVRFHGAVRHAETPAIYCAHALFVNLSRSGMFDKTLLEAAACGCLVLASSEDFATLSSDPPCAIDARAVADALGRMLGLSEDARATRIATLRKVAESHSLESLMHRLFDAMSV